MKMVVGLTGGYCSGKNEAAVTFSKAGFHLIDVDILGHKALALCTQRLSAVFGKDILGADGLVQRKALADIVFSSPEKLQIHESIVHPVMLDLLDKEIAEHEKICINAALLYRFPQTALCDLIIEVRAPFFTRIRRGQSRDRLGVVDILKRMANQQYLWALRPTENPRVVYVDNDGDLEALEKAILAALATIPEENRPISR
jgi:dephospho-CoA kinase